MKLRILTIVATVSLAAVFAVQACGGDNNNGNDAGSDATTNDVAIDKATNDVVQQGDGGGGCPTYTGSSGVCKALVARCQACGSTFSSCQTANFTTECEGLTPLLSAAYVNAVTACEAVCDSDASSACQKASLADASLTSAQQKIATDYCSVCDAGSNCVATIESNLNVVEYSDTLAATIDSNCKPDAAAACQLSKFGTCVLGTVIGTLPPNPCADAGTD